jgi:hypothetical protein
MFRLLLLVPIAYADRLPLGVAPVLIAGDWSVLIGLLIWQATGVTRSALRYEREKGNILYPALACLSILVLCASAVIGFVNSGVPQLAEARNIFRGDPQWPDPVIRVLQNKWELEYEGVIKVHSAARLEQALDQHPEVTVLYLDTVGGREREAISMARIVRSHHLSTYVDAVCASAGTLVFIAGKERILLSGARLGFHSATAPGLPDSGANRMQVEALTEAGAKGDFIDRVVGTLPASVWYPDNDELIRQGIVTRISDGIGFSLGTRSRARYDEKGLRAELLEDAVMKAVSQREPAAFAAAIADAAKSVAAGHDLNASLRGVVDLKTETVRRAFPTMSDNALDDFLDLELEVLSRNMYREPKATLQVAMFKASPSAVPDYPKKAETRFVLALLAGPKTSPATISPEIAEQAQALFLSSSKALGEDFRYPSVPAARQGQAAMCEVLNDYLAAIKHQPDDHRHPLIRFFVDRLQVNGN